MGLSRSPAALAKALEAAGWNVTVRETPKSERVLAGRYAEPDDALVAIDATWWREGKPVLIGRRNMTGPIVLTYRALVDEVKANTPPVEPVERHLQRIGAREV